MKVLFDHAMRGGALAVVVVLFLGAVAAGEHDLRAFVFVVAVAALLGTAVLAVSRRPRFSILATVALLAAITVISAAKMKFMGVALHAFDVFFYLRDASVADFLLADFLWPIAMVAGLAVAGAAFVWAMHRREAPVAMSRRAVALALPPLLLVAMAVDPKRADDRLDTYYFGFHLTSSLFVSLADVGSLFGDPAIVERLKHVPATDGYAAAPPCPDAPAGRPDIVVALMESAFPPSLYPTMKSPPDLERSFLSADGRLRALQVETFGGGTWITSAGLFAGLPATEFGWMRPYLPYYLRGRVHHSLALSLARCGYDTMVVSPLAYRFVDEGPFLTSIGFSTYLDWKAIGAASKHERDRVYFDAALKRIAAHRAASDRPLLLFVMTMATHSPYDTRFDPAETLPGEPWGNAPLLDEFLRRLVLQRRDFDAFAGRLAADPGRHGTILVDFGDHQPVVTRDLAEAVAPNALERWGSVAYRTYWRIAGLGRGLARPLPEVPALDVGYLGTTILEAAGLPLDDVDRELAALRDRCGGRYAGCADRTGVDRHLKRLVEADLLDLGPAAR